MLIFYINFPLWQCKRIEIGQRLTDI